MKKQGFTLIEMLIVVAIVAILSSVFLVGLRSFRNPAFDSRRIADLQTMQSYLELVYTKSNTYPQVTGSPSWEGGAGTGTLEGEIIDSAVGINSIPNDPLANAGSGSQEYVYCVGNGGQSYLLGAKLATAGHSALSESIAYKGAVPPSGGGWSCTDTTITSPAFTTCAAGSNNFCIQF